MNILYIHGFKASFNESSNKVTQLKTIGNVFGYTIDYSKPFIEILKELISFDRHIANSDLIIGSSLGGFFASHVGSLTETPFVAINPSIEPKETLKKYLSEGTIKEDIIESYRSFNLKGCGLILLDSDDEVIDSKKTSEVLKDSYKVRLFKGGNHRFSHMKESLEEIKSFYENSFNYGF